MHCICTTEDGVKGGRARGTLKSNSAKAGSLTAAFVGFQELSSLRRYASTEVATSINRLSRSCMCAMAGNRPPSPAGHAPGHATSRGSAESSCRPAAAILRRQQVEGLGFQARVVDSSPAAGQQLGGAASQGAVAVGEEGAEAELTQCRLLCRARGRQVEVLQGRLQELEAARQAAAAAEARAARAEADLKLAAAELRGARQAEGDAHARRASLESELAVARMELDCQALRVAELEGSAAGQLERRYEAQLRRLRQEYEGELRRLRAELAAALARPRLAAPQAAQDGRAPAAGSPLQASQEAWAEIFSEPPAAMEACHAEAQTESGLSGGPAEAEVSGVAVLSVLQSARDEIERLHAANVQLTSSESEVRAALAEALGGKGDMVSRAEVDAAVRAAVSAERAEACQRAQRERAEWEAWRRQLEAQAAHRGREAGALREACHRLEEATLAMRQGALLPEAASRQEEEEESLLDPDRGAHAPGLGEVQSQAGTAPGSQRGAARSSGGSSTASPAQPVTAAQLRLELAKLGSTTHKPLTPLPPAACSRPWTASLLTLTATPAANPWTTGMQGAASQEQESPALGWLRSSSEAGWSGALAGATCTSDADTAVARSHPSCSPETEAETFATPPSSPQSSSTTLDEQDWDRDLPSTPSHSSEGSRERLQVPG